MCNDRATGRKPGTSAASGLFCPLRYDATVSLKWDFSTLADHLGQVLTQAEADLRLEQAVYGLDAQDEVTLHALLGEGLRRFYDVAREVHYPSTVGRKLTHRQRCDLVLSPKGRPLRLDSTPPTLFDSADQCEPADALWLEVKVAAQWREDYDSFLDYARRHCAIVERFGRFPHRNAILGRASTPEEIEFLRQPGSSF